MLDSLRAFLPVMAIGISLLAPPAQGQILDSISKNGVLSVCIWPDYYGISFRNKRTSALQGVDITLSQELAKDLGVEIAYIETDFSKFVNDIEKGRCHIAMMAVGVTKARAERVAFSEPYMRSDLYGITTNSNRRIKNWNDLDQSGNRVAVLKGTVMEPFMKDYLKRAELVVTTKPGERELEVEAGRADVFITDYPYSRRMLENTDWARLVEPTSTINLTDYAYAVPQGDAEWLDRVNQFVRSIKSDGRLRLAAEPFGLLPIIVTD